MLCDQCKIREAKVYYTEIIGGKKVEQHLCEECAAACTSFQISAKLLGGEGVLDSILSSILGVGQNGGSAAENGHAGPEVVCKSCGMGYQEFLKNGKFGCSACYGAFGRFLPRSLKNIQGADRHTGKVPKGFFLEEEKVPNLPAAEQDQAKDSLTLLQNRLKEAVEREEYEEAAKLRDEINGIKSAKEAKAPKAGGSESAEMV